MGDKLQHSKFAMVVVVCSAFFVAVQDHSRVAAASVQEGTYASEATARSMLAQSNNYADVFGWPVAGQKLDTLVGPISPSQLTVDPKTDGWYVQNGVGNYYPAGADADHPFHPGEDHDRQDHVAAGKRVYAVATGMVVRVTQIIISGQNRGYSVMIASLLRTKSNFWPYALPGTSLSQLPTSANGGYPGLSDWVTINYTHVDSPQVQLGTIVQRGQLVGTINLSMNHLHLEVLAGFQYSNAGANNYNGYYAAQQDITNYHALVATATLSRLSGALAGLPTGLTTQNFDNDTGGYDINGWSTSGLWHTTSAPFEQSYGNTGHAFRYGRGDTASYAITTGGAGQPNGGTLLSPVFLAPPSPTLKFKTYYRTEPVANPATSTARLAGSVDKKQVYVQRVGHDDVILLGEILDYNSSGWIDMSLPIPPGLTGQPIRIWFVFNSVDGNNNDHEGWYVDDVSVTTDSVANTLLTIDTPIVTGLDYTVSPNPADSTKVVVTGRLYGTNLPSQHTEIWFFGPGCESRDYTQPNKCLVPAGNMSLASSTRIDFQAVLSAGNTYIMRVRSAYFGGLFADKYLEVSTTLSAGACVTSTAANAQMRNAVHDQTEARLYSEGEDDSIALDNQTDQASRHTAHHQQHHHGQPEPEEPLPAPDTAMTNNLVPSGEANERPVDQAHLQAAAIATCGYPIITPNTVSKTVNLAGIADFDLALSTTTPNQLVTFGMVIYTSSVPPGLTVSYPANQVFPTNTSIALKVQVYTTTQTPAGTYRLALNVSVGGTIVQNVPVTVTLDPAAPILEFVPPNQGGNVTAGTSITFPIKLYNRTTLNQAITFGMYTMEATNPPGITASWPGPYSLAGGYILTSSVTIYTTTQTPQRTINFELRATAGGITSVETLSVTVTPPTTTTGTVTATTTNNISVPCTLNGTNIPAPFSVTGKAVGSYTLSCTAPTGYTISSIAPSATQTLVAGGNIAFAVNLKAVPTTGTVSITTPGYSGSFGCTLNGQAVTIPATLTNQAPGNYTLAFCSVPSGYTLSISPAATQTLVAGGSIVFAANLTAVPTAGTVRATTTNSINVACTLNGTSVTAPFNQTGKAAGSYTLACTPPSGYSINSILPAATQTLAGGGALTFTVNLTLNSFGGGCTVLPNPGTLGGGETVSVATVGGVSPITFSINGVNRGTQNSVLTIPSQTGVYTATFTATDALNRSASGSCSATINMVTPSISGYTISGTPTHGVPFGMSVSGGGFVSGSAVYFYGPGCTNGCMQPAAGVAVNNANPVSGSISVSAIQLAQGAYTFRVMNPGGLWSGYSTSFTVH